MKTDANAKIERSTMLADIQAFLTYALEKAGEVRTLGVQLEVARSYLERIVKAGCPSPDASYVPGVGVTCGKKACIYCGRDIRDVTTGTDVSDS